MKILHLLASPFYSGPAELVALLAQAQRELGHEVTVAVDRLRTDTAAEELAVPRLQALGLLDDGGLTLSVKAAPWSVLSDARKLRSRGLDVVHTHFTHDHLVASLGRPRGARLVRSIHAPRSLRRLMPPADAWTLPTMSYARRLLGRRLALLPPLLDDAFVAPADRLALQKALGLQGAPLVGMVSTFQPSRRHGLGLDAFGKLRATSPDAHLLLVGDGAEQAALRVRAASLGVKDAVTFAGYRSGDDFVRHLQALDVVWILGLGNDWSGRAAAQARACGVRVVAVDEGGLASLADQVVAPAAEAVVAATLAGERRSVAMSTRYETANRLLELYA